MDFWWFLKLWGIEKFWVIKYFIKLNSKLEIFRYIIGGEVLVLYNLCIVRMGFIFLGRGGYCEYGVNLGSGYRNDLFWEKWNCIYNL